MTITLYGVNESRAMDLRVIPIGVCRCYNLWLDSRVCRAAKYILV